MSNEKNRKPVEDAMYWWLSTSRPFYIGDDYRIDLIYCNRYTNSVKIVVTNLKNMPDEYPQHTKRDKRLPENLEELEILIKGK